MKINFKRMAGTKGTVKFMLDIPNTFKTNARVALQQIGQDVTRFARVGIERGEKTGRLYSVKKLKTRGGRKQMTSTKHRASATGEYPSILTGKFIRSIAFEMKDSNQVEVGARDKKAAWLEFGTKKMGPRPTVKMSVEAREKDTYNYLRWEKLLFGKIKA